MVPLPPSTSIARRTLCVLRMAVQYLLTFTATRQASSCSFVAPPVAIWSACDAMRSDPEMDASASALSFANASATSGNRSMGSPKARRCRAKLAASR